ncbi:DoxX family membrane protein, partial [Archangium sp.]|uniref:DoxX family membrane protein n=1 Tax=Archangium sp. TaxID=1872627 RepID=UPI002EDB648A
MDSRLNQSWWALKLAYGVVPIVAGLDKFFNLLTNWEQYLSPLVARVIPASTFMHAVGIIEIAAGLLVLSKLTRLG